jgi:ABC-type transporter Mla subunit MlaD
LLEIESELESLIRTGPELTGVLADNADVFADDITQLALLADILRDKRFELVDLSRDGARFLRVAGDLLADEKANLACFIRDSGKTNAILAAAKGDLAATLTTNHFFFDAVRQSVRKDPDGATWFRVQLLPHQEPSGEQYAPKRPVPDVFKGRACDSRYGRGVGRATGDAVVPDHSKIKR